ncbi:Phospholipase D1 [Tulasnella sp. 419]|nr:Phospholipase D1 [Tulasnella sp. 419]
MTSLREVVDLARQQQKHPDNNKLGLDGVPQFSDSSKLKANEANGKRQSSLPSSPVQRSRQIQRTFSTSHPSSPLDNTQNRDDTIDPFKADFVRTTSDFRSAWHYEDSEGSKRHSRRKDSAISTAGGSAQHGSGSAAGGQSEEPGLWKRWVEIPLGLAGTEDDNNDDERNEQGDVVRTASPEPHEDGNDEPAHPEESHQITRSFTNPRQPGTRQSTVNGSTSGWPDPLKLFGISRTRSLPHDIEDRQEEDLQTPSGARTPGGRSKRSHKQHSGDTPANRASNIPPTPGGASNKWAMLRQRLKQNSIVPQQRESIIEPSKAAEVDLNDELLAGGLGLLLVKMWFDRDENGRRRVPILLHHLKIRVSDSVHPLHGTHAVFRIECEYANGAIRWVIYRELRDFLSLHTHYRLANATNYSSKDVVDIPDFPRTSLPYFNLLKKQGREKGTPMGRSEFAKMQRMSLENYLIGLIRAVMFRPEANRLCRWFEMSALSVALARRGGIQGKSGLLRVLSSNSSRKSTHGTFSTLIAWSQQHQPKWWMVRESYLVAVEDPAELAIFDVFLLDADFAIERPKRYYRQGLNLLHGEGKGNEGENKDEDPDVDTIASRSTMSKFFSMGSLRSRRTNTTRRDRGASLSTAGRPRAVSASTVGGGDEQKLNGYAHNGLLHPHFTFGGHKEQKEVEKVEAPTTAGTAAGPSSPMDHTDMSEDDDDESHHNHVIDPSIGTDPRALGYPDEQAAMDPMSDPNAPPSNQPPKKKKKSSKDVSQHTFYIKNSQRRMKLVAKNERQMLQFIASMERMANQSHWNGHNRFDSYAPIRLNVAAQWLVDGRDYFWNMSRAIMLAKERIYIHDWWLSPELYLRRPGKEAYRLDRLLKRKAEEGVKIFVILYKEVSNRTTPTDSNYAKQQLMGLHSNILVQRSPSHFSTGTFYWAHHEKLCVVDETIAFMGGLDACFGRWDTPQHVLIDDGDPIGEEGSEQIWRGKDYSNARVMDFHTLSKPDQDMYDRAKVARMPWHDVAMQIVGQPARDLCRHFVQRWNYLLRVKSHSRLMPFLLPPPDFKASELHDQGLTGTCEIQICRSAGPWSLGTQNRIEHSIQNAYLKAIQMSEHFIYIENQFFITSTVVNEVVVENNIGDALVHRIIRAHKEGTPWRACIVIPLLPGFTFPIDHNDASAIRLIMECQNRSICRGPHSIFARLRKEGIDPDDYITFFSLRGWGKLQNEVLTTEQVYIHAKIMIVDDRVAIIGSANINERSQRGDRDSELAAVVRDTDMIESRMAGKPYKVGRFAHTLRLRLMREHVGIDVDALAEQDLVASQPVKSPEDIKTWDPDREQEREGKDVGGVTRTKGHGPAMNMGTDLKDSATQAIYGSGKGVSKLGMEVADKLNIKPSGHGATSKEGLEDEKRTYGSDGSKQPGFASSKIPTLEEKTVYEHRPRETEHGDKPLLDAKEENAQGGKSVEEPQEARVPDGSGELFGAPADASLSPQTDDRPPDARHAHDESTEEEKAAVMARQQLRKHLSVKVGAKPYTLPVPAPVIDENGFADPVSDKFFKDVWIATAVHNTEIYRKVFYCTPDDMVTTWKQYKEFTAHQERIAKPPKEAPKAAPIARVPSEGAMDESNQAASGTAPGGEKEPNLQPGTSADERPLSPSNDPSVPGPHRRSHEANLNRPRRPTNVNEPLEQWERDEMEALLNEVRGHLVIFPTRFLEGEDTANNFLFNSDRILPMPIYN